MIDLHCHLHFGVDDGPKTSKDTLELARGLVKAGVTTVACTSHLRRDKNWINDNSVQQELHERLNSLLNEHDIELKCVSGAEHYIDELLLDTCKKGLAVTYGSSRWLLIETPYHGPPPNLLGLLYEIKLAGYKIVLAHVERFNYLYNSEVMLERLIDAGHVLQINLGSLSGAYSREHKKAAIKLVKNGYAGIAASDCHNIRDVSCCIEKGRRKLEKLIGEDGSNNLLIKNPELILRDANPHDLIY